MQHEIPPVIRRAWTTEDSDATVEHVVDEDVTFHRGLGDAGRKVEHVTLDDGCPCCGNDELVRLVDVSPVERNYVEYWCLMPNCRYFVADELSWATKPHPNFVPDTPEVWDQTVECPVCDDRHTVTVVRGGPLHRKIKETTGNEVPSDLCEECFDRGAKV